MVVAMYLYHATSRLLLYVCHILECFVTGGCLGKQLNLIQLLSREYRLRALTGASCAWMGC
jgi:hypothetical protein